MLDLSTLLSFAAVVIGLFLIPGPAVLLTAARTMQSGRKAGIITGLGLGLGDLIHTICAAAGLSAILMTSASAFNAVKIAGAAYLFYMGIRALLVKASDSQAKSMQNASSSRIFGEAVLAEVLNPKTALFFLAFLPQFIDPAAGASLVQLLLLGLIFVVMAVVYTTIIACMMPYVSRAVKKARWLNRSGGKVTGAIYIALGLKVAFQGR